MGKKKKAGTLVPTRNGWSGRAWILVDGVEVKKQVKLETKHRAVAEKKLADMIAGATPAPEPEGAADTFKGAAERLCEQWRVEGLGDWKRRRSRLRRFAFPVIGHFTIPSIRTSQIREVLAAGLGGGLSRSSLHQLRTDCSQVFEVFRDDQIIDVNPARLAKLPPKAVTDLRPRLVLTDEEINRFMSNPAVPAELHVLALCSRDIGGMRTSDLHAWDWAHFDLDSWATALVERPKTDRKGKPRAPVRHEVPDHVLPVIQAWWDACGRPYEGPVFPCRRGSKLTGSKAGDRKRSRSYAEDLREWLWETGIVRPLPGFAQAKTDEERRKRCALQVDTVRTRRVDFHSFRRAYCTALADSGVNAQTAMALAGHSVAATHMRYVDRLDRTYRAPASALSRGTFAPDVMASQGVPQRPMLPANTPKTRRPRTS
jgi:integrase